MSVTCPLYPQLLSNWCGAAKRRDVPIGDILSIPVAWAENTLIAPSSRQRRRPHHHNVFPPLVSKYTSKRSANEDHTSPELPGNNWQKTRTSWGIGHEPHNR